MKIQRHLKIDTIKKIKEFVAIADEFTGEIQIESGRYCIDGRSMMGIFTLNILMPLRVTIEHDNFEEIEIIDEKLREYYS